ncbi:MAG TPA: DUF4058 family protein [Candidatus Obscuribacterales bacterium]
MGFPSPNLQNVIPNFQIPLKSEDIEPLVYLHTLLNSVYNVAGYHRRIDYTRNPLPPLSDADAALADALLREQGLR